MDQKRIEMINVEECKKLFEYEMTEVALMLKGEFAAVSGDTLGLSHCRVSNEKLNVPQAIASQGTVLCVETDHVGVEKELVEKLAVSVGLFCKESADCGCSEQVAVIDLALPDTKLNVDICEIPLVSVKPLEQIAVPEIAHVEISQIPSVELTEQIDVGKVPDAMGVEEWTVSPVEYTVPKPEVPMLSVAPKMQIPTIEVKQSGVQIPAVVPFDLNYKPTECKTVSVEVPSMKTFALLGQIPDDCKCIEKTNIKTEKIEQIDVSKIETPQIPTIEVSAISVGIPDVGGVRVSSIPQIMPEFAGVPTNVVDMNAKGLNANFAAIGSLRVENLKLENKLPTVTRVSVPTAHLTVDSASAEIKIPKPISFEETRCCAVNPVLVDYTKTTIDVAVPTMSDIQKECEEILAIAVGR